MATLIHHAVGRPLLGMSLVGQLFVSFTLSAEYWLCPLDSTISVIIPSFYGLGSEKVKSQSQAKPKA